MIKFMEQMINYERSTQCFNMCIIVNKSMCIIKEISFSGILEEWANTFPAPSL